MSSGLSKPVDLKLVNRLEGTLLAAVIFGWPAVLASLVLAVMGIATGRARPSVAAAVVACPFLLYVSGAPGLRWVSAISGVLLFSAAVAVARRHRWAAVLLVTPYIGLCGYVARLVLNQRAG